MLDPDVCDQAIAEGKIDGVGMARNLLADPEWANKAESGNKEEIKPCIGCHIGCLGRLFQGKRMGCAVNPECCAEIDYNYSAAETPKKVDEKKTTRLR